MTVTLRPVCLALLTAVLARAEDAAPTPVPNEISRAANLNSALKSGFAYSPPKVEEPTPPPPEDKPKNEIVRLPTYVVTGQRPPIFNDKNLRTNKKDLGKFSQKKYLSELDRGVLNKVTLPWLSNDKRAIQAYYDDERKKNVTELNDASLMYESTGDDTKAKDTLNDAATLEYRSSSSTPATRNNGTWFGEQK